MNESMRLSDSVSRESYETVSSPSTTITQSSQMSFYSTNTLKSDKSAYSVNMDTPVKHANPFPAHNHRLEHTVRDENFNSIGTAGTGTYEQLYGSADHSTLTIPLTPGEFLLALAIPFAWGAQYGMDNAPWSVQSLFGGLWELLRHQTYRTNSLRGALFSWSTIVGFVFLIVWTQTESMLGVVSAVMYLYFLSNSVFLAIAWIYTMMKQI